MDFYEVLNEVVVLLQQHGRVSHRAPKRQFGLDDDFIEDLKDELLHSRHPIADQDGESLIWTGALATTTPSSAATPLAQPDDTQEARAAAVQPSSQPFAPDAERRQLTVMFCDLADATKLSGQLDPEDLRDIIRAYQATSAEVIAHYDGYIAPQLGDGLMVYFG